MALPSQTPRSGMSTIRFSGGRRRSRRRRTFATLVIVAGVVAAGWWGLSSIGGGPEKAAGGSTGLDEQAAEATRRTDAGADRGAGDTSRSALAALNERRMERQAALTPPAPQAEPAGTSRPDRSAPMPAETTLEMGAPAAPPAEEEVVERPTMGDRVEARPSGVAMGAIEEAERLLATNRPVNARDVLNRALYARGITDAERGELRSRLAAIGELVTFSPRVFPGDPMADTYVVRSGDALTTIPQREGFRIDYRLMQRLNRISDPNRIRVGQRLKALYGPFHAVVDKSAFRLDLYADQKDTAGNRIYVRSFPVGLGEYGSTPIGTWRVAEGRKLINPAWANPRTGERYAADDPENPIGERWIALEGTDAQTSLLSGYGIHGTIDPGSIGREESMGCVRLLAEDVALVYELLVGGQSEVEIVE
jgi:hypothetical protein